MPSQFAYRNNPAGHRAEEKREKRKMRRTVLGSSRYLVKILTRLYCNVILLLGNWFMTWDDGIRSFLDAQFQKSAYLYLPPEFHLIARHAGQAVTKEFLSIAETNARVNWWLWDVHFRCTNERTISDRIWRSSNASPKVSWEVQPIVLSSTMASPERSYDLICRIEFLGNFFNQILILNHIGYKNGCKLPLFDVFDP